MRWGRDGPYDSTGPIEWILNRYNYKTDIQKKGLG